MNQQLRLTPEERDRVLDLAARLQAQHEATIAVDDLARAAEESGIEARFVHEAALVLSRRPEPLPRSFLLPFCLFVLQAALFLGNEFLWQRRGSVGLEWLDLLGAALVAFPLALWAARTRGVRRFMLVVPSIAWVSVALPYGGLSRILLGYSPIWIPGEAMQYAGAQTLAVLLALAAVRGSKRSTDATGGFQLHRGRRI